MHRVQAAAGVSRVISARLIECHIRACVQVVGHSLGAGTAALVAMLAHNNDEVCRMHSHPPCRTIAVLVALCHRRLQPFILIDNFR